MSVGADWHRMAPDESAFEDGTLNFLGIPDVEFGLGWLESAGRDDIHRRVRALTGWLLDHLGALRHSNGRPLVRLYGPRGVDGRGATVAFNVLDPEGQVVDERLVAREATASGLSLRTGCFCNPGAGEAAFSVGRRQLRIAPRRKARTVDDYLGALGLPSGGAVRVSFGLASNESDARALLAFLDRTYTDRHTSTADLVPRERC